MRTIDIIIALLLVFILTGCAWAPTMDADVAESIVHLDKMVVRVVKNGEDDPALKEATLLLSERLRKLAETELKIQGAEK
ncbi:MAG: hypothetical protein E3J72_12020 [Planctomycetota bacterium]|nr:MAG: hypothetical protein E3J72_12020 [Planctomycetota bacterium]